MTCITLYFQLAKSFDPSKIDVEVVPESKGSKRADDIRPDVEIVGEQVMILFTSRFLKIVLFY